MKSAPPESNDARPLYAAAALMAASLGVALYLSFQPERLIDLHRVTGWSEEWLRGVHVYGGGRLTDYPPWAVVALSPLALVPAGALALLWAALNVAMLAAVAMLLARRLGAGATTTAALTCLLIAAGAGRTLNQFSLAAFAFGALGFFGTGPARGAWLGLALLKPQVGGLFLVAAAVDRRWRDLAVASAVCVALTLVYALVAHVSLWQVLPDYWASARAGRESVSLGRTEIAPALQSIWPAIGSVMAAIVTGAILAAPLIRSRMRDTSRGAFWLLAALVSLLSIRHLSYDFILLLPWIATLESAPLWLAACLLVASPSAIIGVVAPLSFAATHADRALLAGLWLAYARKALTMKKLLL